MTMEDIQAPSIEPQQTVPRQEWTKEQDDDLRRRWGAGDRARVIAQDMGRTRNSVIGRAQRLGLSEKKDAAKVREIVKRAQVARRAPLKPMDLIRGVVSAVAPKAATNVVQFYPPDGTPLLELHPFQCRWIINSPDVGELHLFCRHGSISGSPYCGMHTKLAWRIYAA